VTSEILRRAFCAPSQLWPARRQRSRHPAVSPTLGAVLEPALEGFSPTLEFPEIGEAQALLANLLDRLCYSLWAHKDSNLGPAD
jgi:hypothetical protein